MATERRVKYNKDPEEKWSIIVNFAKAFPQTTNEITSAEVTAITWDRDATEDRTDTDDIFQETVFQIVDNAEAVEVFIEGGTANNDYKIRVKATIDDGAAVLIKSFLIRVRNQ